MSKAFPANAAWLETNWQVLNLTMMNVLFVMLVLWAISMMQAAEHTETKKTEVTHSDISDVRQAITTWNTINCWTLEVHLLCT